MARVRIVLVRPEHPANVGASARVVRNTGLDGLDLVAPGDWRTVEAWRTAWGAADVLEQALVHQRLDQAVASSAYVVALSRRAAAAEALLLDVRDAAAEISALPATATAALVFGPETAGLTLEELAFCGRTAFIPSAPEQPSLNLSHAVAVAAHEVFRASGGPHAAGASPARLATTSEKEHALALLFRGLESISALSDPRRGVYTRLWRGLFQRSDVTPAEVRMIAHMGRKLARVGRPPRARVKAAGRAGSRPVEPTVPSPQPYTDVQVTAEGLSLPLLKWRELLFVGAFRREGASHVRDPARPLPPFALEGLFPDRARFEAEIVAGRVLLRRRG